MALRSDWSDRECPIARSLDVVGDPWTMLILRQALSGVRRFEDFRSQLGVADSVLSKRLQGLVDADLLRRSPYRDGQRTRHEYLLTPAGADLLPVINALVLWGEKYRPHTDPGVRMQLVHAACGEVSSTAEACSRCGGRMDADRVIWRKSWRSPSDLQLVGAAADGRSGVPGTRSAATAADTRLSAIDPSVGPGTEPAP